jgi:hypothetical protein
LRRSSIGVVNFGVATFFSSSYKFTKKILLRILFLVMETKLKLNELEFKSRVKKIVPYLEISVGTKEKKEYEFELAFEREYYQQNEPKTEVFGDVKRNINI